MPVPNALILSTCAATASAASVAGAELFVSSCLIPSLIDLAPSPANTSSKLVLFRRIYTNALSVLPPLTMLSTAAFGASYYYGGGTLALYGGGAAFSIGIYTLVSVASLNARLIELSRKTKELEVAEVVEAEKLLKVWGWRNWARVGLSALATGLGVQLIVDLAK